MEKFNKKNVKNCCGNFLYEIQLFFWWKSVPGSPRTNVKNTLVFFFLTFKMDGKIFSSDRKLSG
jgi:hypothetical protein